MDIRAYEAYRGVPGCEDVEEETVLADFLGAGVLGEGKVARQQLGTPWGVFCGLQNARNRQNSSEQRESKVYTINPALGCVDTKIQGGSGVNYEYQLLLVQLLGGYVVKLN